MTNKVIETIKNHCMIAIGDRVGVGVSGGADSVALLHFLVTNQKQLGIKEVVAIHINHSIRGEEAVRDMLFTKELCEKLGVQLECKTIDVPGEAKKTGESLETCARRMRYEIFKSYNFSKFATAHNLNDRMETFFFNLSRGTSLSGLLSIPYVRDNVFIRPLLDCTRNEIEEYIKENSLSFVTDSTNNCDDYTRNKIRHNIIPQLFELNPSFDKAFLKCEKSIELDNDYINSEVNMLFADCNRPNGSFCCSQIKSSPRAIRLRTIAKILKSQNIADYTREHINAIEHIILNGGSADIKGTQAHCERDLLYFGKKNEAVAYEKEVNNSYFTYVTPYATYKFHNLNEKDLQNLNKELLDNSLDCDKIVGALKFRSRNSGDSIKLRKRKVTKTLKQLYNERKIPVSMRPNITILADDKGIVWLEGFGVCERCAITAETKQAIKIVKVED